MENSWTKSVVPKDFLFTTLYDGTLQSKVYLKFSKMIDTAYPGTKIPKTDKFDWLYNSSKQEFAVISCKLDNNELLYIIDPSK